MKVKKIKFGVVIVLIVCSLFSCFSVTKRVHRKGFYVELAGKIKKPNALNNKGLMQSYSNKKTDPVLIVFPEKDIEVKIPKENIVKNENMPSFFSHKKRNH